MEVSPDFTGSHGSWSVSVWLLDTTGGRCTLYVRPWWPAASLGTCHRYSTCGLGGQLLPWALPPVELRAVCLVRTIFLLQRFRVEWMVCEVTCVLFYCLCFVENRCVVFVVFPPFALPDLFAVLLMRWQWIPKLCRQALKYPCLALKRYFCRARTFKWAYPDDRRYKWDRGKKTQYAVINGFLLYTISSLKKYDKWRWENWFLYLIRARRHGNWVKYMKKIWSCCGDLNLQKGNVTSALTTELAGLYFEVFRSCIYF